MPLRVGIDLVSVESVDDAIREHADRYLERIYTARELADCAGSPERLAARFAAKEAVLKILRPDDDAVPWRTIEVVRNRGGWVELALSGPAAARARETGVTGFAVSLTHEATFASAVVVAELSTGEAEGT